MQLTAIHWAINPKLLLLIQLGVLDMQQASRKAVTVHVQQYLNGPHGTPVHDFLSVV